MRQSVNSRWLSAALRAACEPHDEHHDNRDTKNHELLGVLRKQAGAVSGALFSTVPRNCALLPASEELIIFLGHGNSPAAISRRLRCLACAFKTQFLLAES